MMNNKFLFISLVYASSAFNHTQDLEPMPLDMPALHMLDGAINVSKIAEFCDKIDALVTHVMKSKGQMFTLKDFVALEEIGELDTELIKKLFDMYTKKFLQVSHSYFNDIKHLKPVLVKILSIWAQQRDRHDSLVLLWADIENGKEEEFVKQYTPTLKAFYTFLIDIDTLLWDVMHSCPKSYAKYLECKKIVEKQHHQQHE